VVVKEMESTVRYVPLQRKIGLAILATFLVMAVVFGIVLGFLQKMHIRNAMRQSEQYLEMLVQREAEPLANELFEKRFRAVELRIEGVLVSEGLLSVTVYAADGGYLVHLDRAGNRVPEAQEKRTVPAPVPKTARGLWRDLPTLVYEAPVLAMGDPIGFIRLSYSMAQMERERRVFYFATGVLLTVTFVLMLVVLNKTLSITVSRPITALKAAMLRVEAEGPGESLSGASHDEIGDLIAAFNRMSRQLREMLNTIQLEVSEREQAEEALRKNEAVLRSLLEATPAGVSLLMNRVFVKVNPALCRITGYSEDEMIGMATRILYPDDDEFNRVGRDGYEQMKREGLGILESRLKRKDGALIDALLCLSPFDPNDATAGVTATVLDITERKRAEGEMRRLRNYLSNIINSMPSVLVGVDVNGCVTQWNAAAVQASGVKVETAQGQPLDRLLPGLGHLLDKVRQAMRACTVESEAKVPRVVAGETRYEDITVYPLVSNGVEGAVIRVDDVTDRVRIEEIMVQSEKMLSVGGLAAGMAHEINNPLGVILQASQNVLRRVSPDLPANVRAAEECGTTLGAVRKYLEYREIATFLEDIRSSGLRAAQIVENMLAFSRKPDAEGSSTDLAELLDRTLLLADSDYDLKKRYDFRQIEIVREYHPDVPLVVCQAGKMQQVFLNILRNGAEAMMETRDSGRAPRFVLRVLPEGSKVRVEIEDNGPGLDEATRRRVFEPFFTTKPPGIGTGLGLSVSYFIVTQDHLGTLLVKSQPGVGSSFIIELPVGGYQHE
jgi:PAS domain S-box-containing protein